MAHNKHTECTYEPGSKSDDAEQTGMVGFSG